MMLSWDSIHRRSCTVEEGPLQCRAASWRKESPLS